MNDFSINILGLSKKEHSFDFHLGETFFTQYGKEVVSGGEFEAKVILNKRETLIEADFTVQGKTHLICDRSLDPFDFPMEIDKKVIFKFGEKAEEISDEIIVIPHDQDVLDVGQLMYEFIVLEVPIKKIHPRFEDDDEEENEEGKLIYQTEKDEEAIDPRWEVLKKLKQ
ncbi:MAG: YceD family protein [Cyclobacteriaceae bacterium]